MRYTGSSLLENKDIFRSIPHLGQTKAVTWGDDLGLEEKKVVPYPS